MPLRIRSKSSQTAGMNSRSRGSRGSPHTQPSVGLPSRDSHGGLEVRRGPARVAASCNAGGDGRLPLIGDIHSQFLRAAAVPVPEKAGAWHAARVRMLVIGAGVAGLTLAARLCQQGRPPVIAERSASADIGYAIGLYPLGSCVLHGLGTYGELAGQAVALQRYEVASAAGRVLQAVDMSVLTAASGPLYMVTRPGLLRLLESSCAHAEMRRGVTVRSLAQGRVALTVTFDDGSAESFDAVVGCDGIHSCTRDRVFGPAGGSSRAG